MTEPEFRIDWAPRTFTYTEDEIAAAVAVLRGTGPLTKGPERKAFEAKFAEYHGVPPESAVTVTSATSALELAAMGSGLGPGDEVIVPAHTWCATAIAMGRTGATLKWADIDPETRVVSAETIEPLLSERTKAIVVVHLYGLMADMEPILSLAKARGIKVVEDCAQAIDATYRGRKAGTLGDFGVFSFHAQKNVTTMGEGGMLLCRDAALGAKMRHFAHKGVRPFPPGREHYWIPTMSNVDQDLEGMWPHNFPLSEAQCAIGAKVLDRLPAMTEERNRRADKVRTALADFPELSFQRVGTEHRHAYHLLSARYDGQAYGRHRDDLIKLLAYEYRIKAIVQYYPLYRYPLFQKMGLGIASCPNTDVFYDNMVSFPFHLWMSDADLEYMIESTRAALAALRQA